jgi:hypothetical protein
MTSLRANDLDYYDKLLSVLEKDTPYEADAEVDAIAAQYAFIKNGVQMRMIADMNGMMEEQHFYKQECCRLLLRSLELWTAMKAQPLTDQGKRLLKNGVVMTLIDTLEELYLFYNGLSKIQAGEL